MPRLPTDAFERFTAMGAARSYAKLAAALGCSKRSVTAKATKENWQARLVHVEQEAQRKTVERAVEDVVAIDEKHLRMARAIQARALEALKNSPLGNGAAAVRALDVAIKIERAILGRKDGAPAEPVATHAQLLAAANAMPDEAVQAALKVIYRLEAEKKQAAAAPPPAEPIVPPSLAPRVVSEN